MAITGRANAIASAIERPKSLAPMQRHVAIAIGGRGFASRSGRGFRQDRMRCLPAASLRRCSCSGKPLAVRALDHEQCFVALLEGELECPDHRERVLALEIAREIEREQEHEVVLGELEVRAAGSRQRLGSKYSRHRHAQHRNPRLCGDRLHEEIARGPDLVEVAEPPHPAVGNPEAPRASRPTLNRPLWK